jgi:hypothetical protein
MEDFGWSSARLAEEARRMVAGFLDSLKKPSHAQNSGSGSKNLDHV